METLELIMMNHYEQAYVEQLNAHMQEAFGFVFTEWFQRNQWRENYECYSIMDGHEMLSNVGVYKTPLLIGGRRHEALQIGGVATKPGHWGQGHLRRIMEHIQAKYPGVPQFLHANKKVTQFYPRFGFRRVMESAPSIAYEIDNETQPAMLHLGDERLERFFQERSVYSGIVDCMETQTVQVFHQIMDHGKATYHIPELDVAVIAEQDGEKLYLADVIARQPVRFDALAGLLPFSGVKRVAFGFCPDWLGVEPDWAPITDDDSALFVLGDLPLPDRFHIPDTSLT